jgi:LysM repeat protein
MHRIIFTALSALVILVTLLVSVSPAFAKNGGTTPYTVKKDENVTMIAKQFGLTVEKILAANPEIKDPNKLIAGQVIILPTGRNEGPNSVDKAARIYVWQREKDGGRVEKADHLYLVKNGDTLINIAKRYGISMARLLEVNPQIDNTNQLYRGELVRIPNGLAEFVPPFYETPRPAPGENN